MMSKRSNEPITHERLARLQQQRQKKPSTIKNAYHKVTRLVQTLQQSVKNQVPKAPPDAFLTEDILPTIERVKLSFKQPSKIKSVTVDLENVQITFDDHHQITHLKLQLPPDQCDQLRQHVGLGTLTVVQVQFKDHKDFIIETHNGRWGMRVVKL